MVEARRTNSTRNGYVNGSAVKRMDAMPDFWEEEQAMREKKEREYQHKGILSPYFLPFTSKYCISQSSFLKSHFSILSPRSTFSQT